MKTAALMSAQLHRNPRLLESPREPVRMRYEQRLSPRRGRRRRRP